MRDDLVSCEDLRRRAREMLRQVVEELSRAPRAVLGLRLSVVPRDAARLPLDVRAGDVLFIPAGTPHWYEAGEGEPFEFLCVVPNKPDTIELIGDKGAA